jgi:hypothetical protein
MSARAPRLPLSRTPTASLPRQSLGASTPGTQEVAASTRSSPAMSMRRRSRLLSAPVIFSVFVTVLLVLGWCFPTERYITPNRGIGYSLGIIGGSMMVLLLLYSARKRVRWLKFLGPTVGWFRYHMVLGVLGPLCILYHSNFGLGAANSNVALFSMLTVAGSGLIGRYIYARIHHGLYGSKATLGELRVGAENLRAHSGAFAFLPDLVNRLEACEQALLKTSASLPVLGIPKLIIVGLRSLKARWQLRSYIRACLRAAAKRSKAVASERRRLRRTAFAYVDRRLGATRRVAGFQAYERLFSLWHALHLPLIFMMLAAGIVHVIAVNIY